MPSMKTSGRSGGASRGGGIRKRGPVRTDRDGDMDMDGPGARAGKRGRGSGGRSLAGKSQAHGRADAIEKAITSAQDTKDTQANIRRNQKTAGSKLEQFSIRGWKESKAASNRDGGVESLVAFLERRMNAQSKGPRVKITKSRVDGDTLVVSVRPELAERMLRIDGNTFAGVSITVAPHEGSVNEALGDNTPGSTLDTKTKMKMVLGKRYFPDTRLLDLSKLPSDPDLVAMGIFETTSRESKFFLALMKVWEMQFTNSTQRREAVMSVSLAYNQLANISAVTTLSQTLPDIKNLDLSNNNFKDMDSLLGWRWKFRDLEFLDLTGNPFSSDPNFKATMLKWFPNLKILNNVQVRTAEEVALKKKTPIPVQPPYFQDEGLIADNFVRAFFPGYDKDRMALLGAFYDENSTFSLNINTSAPRASQTGNINWDPYIKKSRNLFKITHLPARMSRSHNGIASIRTVWGSLPETRHPDMTMRPAEWMVECHPIPGLPDPTGQSATGVGGLIVTVHGSFEENVRSAVEQRSFDRTFILGPGSGPGGIRVLNDALCLRAYGGYEAWVPATSDAVASNVPPAAAVVAPVTAKTDTQVQQEQMIAELSAKSRMTLQYSEMALSGNGWNLEAAWSNFEQLKLQNALPADAFLPAV